MTHTEKQWTVEIGTRFIHIRTSDNEQVIAAERDGDAEETLALYEQIVREHNAHAMLRSSLEAAVITLEKPWEEHKVELALITLKAALTSAGKETP